MNDLIGQAKAKPGEVFAASASLASRLGLELLNLQMDVKITHVPYKGAGAAVTDLVGNRFAVMFATPPTVLSHIKSGKVKGIAVTGLSRLSTAPDLPTVADALKLPGFEASTWYGVIAPARTPPDIVRRLGSEIIKAVEEPAVRARLTTQGIEVAGSTPEQFKTYIASETEKWAKVIKAAGVEPEK